MDRVIALVALLLGACGSSAPTDAATQERALQLAWTNGFNLPDNRCYRPAPTVTYDFSGNDAIPEAPGATGFFAPSTYSAVVLWPKVGEDTWRATYSTSALVHELNHARLWCLTGNGDGDHTDESWRDQDPNSPMVRATTALAAESL